jgi:glucose/arabinose dehydrogenase
MALHPKFPENHKYYFAKHTVDRGQFSTIIAEGEASSDLQTDSGRPSRLILKWDEATGVHYGGGLAFGPDGYLYIGTGDSGPQEDPQGHAQNSSLLLGKMLRIDVDHFDSGKAYGIPSDNPFLGQAEFRPEIWAWGFREPWRFSFDPITGELWVGDVGQDRYEEVDVVRRGENYGWNVYEGFELFSNRFRRAGATYVAPVFAYGRKFGVSVTGGYVCRFGSGSSFDGVYVFGDFQSRRIFGLTQHNRGLSAIRQIGTAPQRVVSFGRDLNGGLYVVGYEGMLFRLIFEGTAFR